MSNLVRHAEEEMRRAKLYDKDADYGGMIPEAVMKLVHAHAEEGHSGGSHHLVMEIFSRLIHFKTLTPITANPEEWMDVGSMSQSPMWQNKRDPSFFSTDAGKTWYNVDTRQKDAFRKEIEHAINKNSLENGSDTHDFILAEYLMDCLEAFDKAVNHRTKMREPENHVKIVDAPSSTPGPVK